MSKKGKTETRSLKYEGYNPPEAKIWQGRSDSQADERFFQRIQTLNLAQQSLPTVTDKTIALLGFCSDTGVQRNLGRPGADAGPDAFRLALGKLALHHATPIFDVGDIAGDDDLAASQLQLANTVAALLQHQFQPLLIGGGHEIAWGHYQGIRQHYPTQRLGIINFDAHFDLRPNLQDGAGTSGTPFLQIANHCQQQQLDFNYCVLGLQPQANTHSLYATAKDLKVTVVEAQRLQTQPEETQSVLQRFIQQQDIIYLTLCLDVFSTAVAPGVSAPQPLGLLPEQVLPLLQFILQSGKVVSVDIAELSPAQDRDNITANLAAQCAAQIIQHWSVSHKE